MQGKELMGLAQSIPGELEIAQSPKVYQAISQVSSELSKAGISKERSNAQQGYKFRGIDDCLNALAPLLSKHQLVIMPYVQERQVVERETKNGGALFYVTVTVLYHFVHTEDGSRHYVRTYGEAMDSADKATNKAMSAAYKYAVIQTFCIPTEGDNDADATTPEVKPAQTYTKQKKEVARKIAELRKPEAQGAGHAGKEVVAPFHEAGVTPQASDSAPAPFTDEDWESFLEYMYDDPDRTTVGKQLKDLLRIGKVAELQGSERVGFVRQFQDSCRETGVLCIRWVA